MKGRWLPVIPEAWAEIRHRAVASPTCNTNLMERGTPYLRDCTATCLLPPVAKHQLQEISSDESSSVLTRYDPLIPEELPALIQDTTVKSFRKIPRRHMLLWKYSRDAISQSENETAHCHCRIAVGPLVKVAVIQHHEGTKACRIFSIL